MPTSQRDRALIAFERLMAALRPSLDQGWLEATLTMAQLRALWLLTALGQASGRELAQELGVGASAISQVVDRLAAQGYIEREEDRDDRRVVWLRPTAAGRGLVDRMLVGRRERLRGLLAVLTEDQVSRVADGLELLVEAARRGNGMPEVAEVGH